MERCEICGRRPAKKMSFSAHKGFLVFAQSSRISGVFCRDHAIGAYAAAKKASMKGMWFSSHSLVFGTLGGIVDSAKLLNLPPPVKDGPGVSHKVACPSCGTCFFEPAGPGKCGKCQSNFIIASCSRCRTVQTLSGSNPHQAGLTCTSCGATTRGLDCVRNWIFLLLPQALAEVTALVSKADEFTDEVELKPFESVVQERYSAERGWLRKRLEECLATGSLDIMTECGPRFPQPVQDAVLAIGLAVANADGVIEQVEFEALRRVAVLLDKNPDVAIGNWEAFNTAQEQAAWWNTLNVPPTISLEGLSKAYRDLARKCHPDRWHNADEGQRTAAA
jgi:hypothetical protein